MPESVDRWYYSWMRIIVSCTVHTHRPPLERKCVGTKSDSGITQRHSQTPPPLVFNLIKQYAITLGPITRSVGNPTNCKDLLERCAVKVADQYIVVAEKRKLQHCQHFFMFSCRHFLNVLRQSASQIHRNVIVSLLIWLDFEICSLRYILNSHSTTVLQKRLSRDWLMMWFIGLLDTARGCTS